MNADQKRQLGEPLPAPSEPPEWFRRAMAYVEYVNACEVPNRLKGAYINEDGDAV